MGAKRAKCEFEGWVLKYYNKSIIRDIKNHKSIILEDRVWKGYGCCEDDYDILH